LRYLIISDIHGNCDALETVLDSVSTESFDEILVLGDLVGYGAGPNEVVDRIRNLQTPTVTIRGNHDKVAAEIDDGFDFNETALDAIRWTTRRLTPENLAWIRELQEGPVSVRDDLVICHGSPIDEDMYLLSAGDALEVFEVRDSLLAFFGHTHLPSIFMLQDGEIALSLLRGDGVEIEIEPDAKHLLNPGSVGQPRDHDPRASFMTYDSEKNLAVLRRIDYPIERAQQRILDAGLPQVLADRLAIGY